jgi:hypothetical protein
MRGELQLRAAERDLKIEMEISIDLFLSPTYKCTSVVSSHATSQDTLNDIPVTSVTQMIEKKKKR